MGAGRVWWIRTNGEEGKAAPPQSRRAGSHGQDVGAAQVRPGRREASTGSASEIELGAGRNRRPVCYCCGSRRILHLDDPWPALMIPEPRRNSRGRVDVRELIPSSYTLRSRSSWLSRIDIPGKTVSMVRICSVPAAASPRTCRKSVVTLRSRSSFSCPAPNPGQRP